jgi:hypothetical protein
MDNTIRCNSGHTEELGDGRSIERGGFAHGVDLQDETNARLLRDGLIIEVPSPADQPDKPPAKHRAAREDETL